MKCNNNNNNNNNNNKYGKVYRKQHMGNTMENEIKELDTM
jgi:hypothetical protein